MFDLQSILLSIIVPVYNVEPYLRKCVDSLLAQDYSDCEIILVDDGSPDRSGEICEEYAARFSNIKVIHRENGGLSAARNSGIEKARGKYVQFVDSDDFLEPNVLGGLVRKMEDDKLDVLRFNYQNVNDRYEIFEPNKDGKLYVDYSDNVCDGLCFLADRLGFACYAWQFIIRRELLLDCRFKVGIYFEDTEWAPRLLLKAKRVTSTDQVVYNYLVRQGSITKSVSKDKKRKVLEDQIGLVDSLRDQMDRCEEKRWFKGMMSGLVISALSSLALDFYDEHRSYIKLLKEKQVFPLTIWRATPSGRLKARIANLSPSFLCFMLHLKRTW